MGAFITKASSYTIMSKIALGAVLSLAAAILALTMILVPVAPQASARLNPAWNITGMGSSGTTLTMTVEGQAGSVTPDASDSTDIYAHIWVLANDDVYAVTSHGAEDYGDPDDNSDDIQWHGHLVFLDQSTGDVCVVAEEDRIASVSGNTITIEGTTGGEILYSVTAKLNIDDEGNICVNKVFDTFNPIFES